MNKSDVGVLLYAENNLLANSCAQHLSLILLQSKNKVKIALQGFVHQSK
jgi:hypothetical protein